MFVRLRPQFEREYPKEADIELTAFPVYESFLGSGQKCVGGGGSGASRVNPSLQLVGEVSGCLIMHMPAANQSGDMLFYGGGVRWTPLAAHRISPYLQIDVWRQKGHSRNRRSSPAEAVAGRMGRWKRNSAALSKAQRLVRRSRKNGPALGVGSGFDVVLTRAFAWRLVNVEYSHAWIGDVDMIQPQNALRVSTGAVLRIGTW